VPETTGTLLLIHLDILLKATVGMLKSIATSAIVISYFIVPSSFITISCPRCKAICSMELQINL